MIDVVLLGTGGMLPLPNRWLSSLLVRAEGEVVLLDCGEGTQIAWRQAGWSFRRLGAICISHTHADHIAGLPGLLHAVSNARRTEPLDIFGPAGLDAVVRGLRSIAPVLPYEVRVHELQGGEAFPLPAQLIGHCEAGEHALPVLAYRIDQPRGRAFLRYRAEALGVPVTRWRTLQKGEDAVWDGKRVAADDVLGPPRPGVAMAYITDTRPLPRFVALARGVDLLVCEGTYGDDEDLPKAMRNTHMTFREAATLAREAGVRQLWITHFSPGLEEPMDFAGNAREVFAETTIAFDGLSTQLVFGEDGG
jgi:ribonuclease Z